VPQCGPGTGNATKTLVYPIRYPGPDGRTRTGPETYERKSDTDKALAVRSIGAEGLHFHDLRHTGNTFATGPA
jgi:hypothetical protein